MCYSLLMNAGEWSTEFLLKVITTILDKEYPDLNTKGQCGVKYQLIVLQFVKFLSIRRSSTIMPPTITCGVFDLPNDEMQSRLRNQRPKQTVKFRYIVFDCKKLLFLLTEVTELNKECLERLLRIPITTDVYNTLEGDVSDYMHLITTPSHMEHLGEYVNTTQDNFTDRVTENVAEGTLECHLHVFYYCMRLLILSIKISNNKNKEKITLICTALKPKIKRICVETKAIVPYV